jgi:hypothetical protein
LGHADASRATRTSRDCAHQLTGPAMIGTAIDEATPVMGAFI